MNSPRAIAILFWLNLALFCVLGIFLFRHRTSNSISHNSTTTWPAALTQSENSVPPQPSQWPQLQSNDFSTYAANLRATGCPEETIRDILLAAITRYYTNQKEALFARDSWKYWTTAEPNRMRLSEPQRAQLLALDNECRLLLQNLFGSTIDPDSLINFTDDQIDHLASLPLEKRAAILNLETKFNERHSLIQLEAETRDSTPDWSKFAATARAKEQALSQLLSPEELFEYQLRTDEIAARMRRNLSGFDATETEFREVFRLRKEHVQKYPAVNPSDEFTVAAESADHLVTEQKVKTFLGDNRYAALQRGSDPRFHNLFLFTQELDLPTDTAATLYTRHAEMRHDITLLQTNPSLDPQERDFALRNFQEEMDRLLHQSLGPIGYAQFQDRGIESFLGN